jgi:invasion protein IalB
MTRITKIIGPLLVLSMACAATALQAAPNDARQKLAQNTAPGPGSAGPQGMTLKSTPWEMSCNKLPKAAADELGKTEFCEVKLLLANEKNEPVLQFAAGVPPKGENQGKPVLTVRLPVNIRVGESIAVAGGDLKEGIPLKLNFCLQGSCIATGVIPEQVFSFLREHGDAASTFSFSDAAGRKIAVPLALKGFSDAWNKLPK